MANTIQGLTTANNKINALLNSNHQVCGYHISSNPPASLIGNNVLMSNTVYQSAVTQTLLVQRQLIEAGVNPKYVKTIGVKHCRFQEVTLTYCLQYDSAKEAQSLLKKLKNYAGVVLKSPRSHSEKSSKKIGFAGSGDSQSWYINKTDDHSVLFYVKDRNQPGKYSSFVSPEVEKAIYTLGQSVIRIEITLSPKYLISHGLDDPQAWRGAKGKAIYQREFDWLRSLLKVDADYRVNKPQERHTMSLGEKEQSVLAWYLKGKAVNQHPQILSGEWNKSPIKRCIQDRLRIDINIPWKTHCRMAIPGLDKLLSLDRLVKPPQELIDHCHVPSTVKRKNGELKKLVDAEIAAAEAKWKKKARVSGKGAAAHAADPSAVSVLQVVLEALRQHGVLVSSPTDGTTSDVSDLME